jgi:oxygen-independent coproporphyrinogen III oxidase
MSGIYIHIPFCKQACHYCDFHFSTSLKKKEELLVALKKELYLRKEEFAQETIATIYFGGGTPSLLTPEELQLLIDEVYQNYNVTKTPEITLEANPDDLDDFKIRQIANSSINRLSIGIQSFFEDDLKLLNRAHSSQEAKRCLKKAKNYFANISLDLIYGIPGMSATRWQQNIETALSYAVPHISAYALTVEPKTALENFIKKGSIPPLDDALAQQHFFTLIALLEAHDFIHYELSNFGKEGFFSKNNTAYWQGKKYIGIGPSAHSYNGTHRSWNVANNSKYIAALQKSQLPSTTENLTSIDRYNEYVMTGLRTIWGVSLPKIQQEFGATYTDYLLEQAKKHIQKNLLFIDTSISKEGEPLQQLKTTKKGKFFSDGIASDLFLLNLQ